VNNLAVTIANMDRTTPEGRRSMLKRQSEVEVLLRHALLLQPMADFPYANLAINILKSASQSNPIGARSSRFQEAESLLRHALELRPSWSNHKKTLRKMLQSVGRHSEAKHFLVQHDSSNLAKEMLLNRKQGEIDGTAANAINYADELNDARVKTGSNHADSVSIDFDEL